jgi:hypothetical protein
VNTLVVCFLQQILLTLARDCKVKTAEVGMLEHVPEIERAIRTITNAIADTTLPYPMLTVKLTTTRVLRGFLDQQLPKAIPV